MLVRHALPCLDGEEPGRQDLADEEAAGGIAAGRGAATQIERSSAASQASSAVFVSDAVGNQRRVLQSLGVVLKHMTRHWASEIESWKRLGVVVGSDSVLDLHVGFGLYAHELAAQLDAERYATSQSLATRLKVLKELRKLGPFAAPYAAKVAYHLQAPTFDTSVKSRKGVDVDFSVSVAAADALQVMGATALPHAPELAGLLREMWTGSNRPALESKRASDTKIPKVAHTLGTLLYSSGAVAALDFFRDSTKPFCRVGVDAFSSAGFDECSEDQNQDSELLEGLARLLKHDSFAVRFVGIKGLCAIGAAAAAYAGQVAGRIFDLDGVVSYAAADAVISMGMPAVPHISAVLRSAADDAKEVACFLAIRALGAMPKEVEAGACCLVEIRRQLASPSALIRAAAIRALGHIAPAAVETADEIGQDELFELLWDCDAEVRQAAATVIGERFPDGLSALLIRKLWNSSAAVGRSWQAAADLYALSPLPRGSLRDYGAEVHRAVGAFSVVPQEEHVSLEGCLADCLRMIRSDSMVRASLTMR